MAHQWEMQMTMDHYGMGFGGSYSNYSNINTSQMNGANMNPGYYYGAPSTNDHSVRVDDMLNFSNAQELFPTASASALADQNHLIGGQGDQSNTASARNSVSSYDSFANEFYVPSEEAAELEWLSKFVDDSYSDMPSNIAGANMGSYMNASNDASQLGGENSSASAGRGARSKRSRAASAVAAAWHALIPPTQSSPSSSTSSSDFPTKPSKGSANRGKKTGIGNGSGELGLEGGVRRCTHCASEKTPQWRTGPLGPKTLCNACGVRYKSGRLMPEYRPAASPTFVLTQHSNSHRKVMELRRQRELMMLRHRDSPSAAAAVVANAAAARPELLYHDYGVC